MTGTKNKGPEFLKIYSGTSGYAYKEWKGVFYPEKTPDREMLRVYSGRLNTVEINNTFYRMPTERVLSSWAGQVPDRFVFALKAPQVITHLKRLRNVEEEAAYFFRALPALGRKLGPVLLQFPKSFRADLPALEDFLTLIPGTISCAFEFRNPSWLSDGTLGLLRKRRFSLCTADVDENPAEEIISTAPWGYLRLRRSDYTDAGMARWIDRILQQRWKKAFVFFKHEKGAGGAEMAMRFQEFAGSGIEKLIKGTG